VALTRLDVSDVTDLDLAVARFLSRPTRAARKTSTVAATSIAWHAPPLASHSAR
jgi:hypothetical protein